ncbi:Bromodomain-containing protein [Gilbertella persicaria]|uniref:Bromodomain-containing protein n=1 Tax=Gilbertella persicaria TaxID=101096 RepID=UPI00221F8648|nr:Bromodomain-containing protein [Gilbertella persicaria]KAI8053670.1 Bromodomain-containing protein [Gilbertella persicaria]
MSTTDWTVLEKLLLSQAVYKYGEDNWFQIARNLKHHALLDRPSDYFNQKNCSLQYYLMVEDLDEEKKQQSVSNQDMPIVVQIARQLYALRLEELKIALAEDEQKFMTLVAEIDDIRAGKWDDQLMAHESPSLLSEPEELIQQGETERIEEEAAKVEAENQANEARLLRPEQEEQEEPERISRKRSLDEDESLIESKRQKTTESPLHIDVPQHDESTDVSQGTTPADTTDVNTREGTESVAESESNAPTPTRKAALNKDDQRHKSWQKNINLLWREIANHKNGTMFMNPIKETIAPRYYAIVKRPMDLKTIKNKIRDGLISTTEEFERDVMLMINNSLMYNKEGTEVYQMAREMLEDTVQQIKTFKAADTDTFTSSHTRAAKDRRKSIVPIE